MSHGVASRTPAPTADASASTPNRGAGSTQAAAPIVLIHGVGFGPETLRDTARALAIHARVICIDRRGYGARVGMAPTATVAEHVEDVIGVLDGAGIERAVVAGMSGGATVALALALSRPERVVTAVAHEPAVGSLSPELRALVRGALVHGGGRELLRVLAGADTWDALPDAVVAMLDASPELVEADARSFLAFEPRVPPTGVGCRLVSSVGERSSALRFTVADRLAARVGGSVAVVPGCGHLPQLDAPVAFARLIVDQAFVNGRETGAR